jgi:hypothetical protein
MSGLLIDGYISGYTTEVTANNQLEINTPLTSSQAGFASLVAENDAGLITESRDMYSLYSSDDARLNVGNTTHLFDYQFTATAQDTDFWYYKSFTMAATQTGGFLFLNSGSTTTTATGVFMQTWRYFKLMANAPLIVNMTVNISYAVQANQIAEFGLFIGNGASGSVVTPADGIYYRLTSTGLIGVINYVGSESTTPLNITITPGASYQFGLVVTIYQVEFWDYSAGILLATFAVPNGNPTSFATMSLPVCFQQRNNGTVSSPMMQLKVGSVRVEQQDLALGMQFPHIQGVYGLAYQGLPGGTQGTLTNYTGNVVLSGISLVDINTTANSLGGITAILPTYTANDDGIVFGYLNPAGSISQTPRTLVITGVQIQGAVTTTLTGGPVLYLYSISFGLTAIQLTTPQSATFTTATTKAPKIIPLGIESYPATAAAGTLGATAPIFQDFSQSPIVVNPGEYAQVIARNIGTITSAGVITISCAFKHYWI